MVTGSWPGEAGVPPDWAVLARRALEFAEMLLRGQDAEDVAQQSMLELWRRLSAGAEIVNPAGLLAAIVRRRAVNAIARSRRLAHITTDALDLHASRWAPDPAEESALSDALGRACRPGNGRARDLIHDALAGGAAGPDEATQAWGIDLLAEAQRACQKKKIAV